MSTLIIGASAAGLATLESLRRHNYDAPITLLGAEPDLPYDRPPLSKHYLATTNPHPALRPEQHLANLNATFHLGDPAVALDAARRTVHTASGRTLTADNIVITTGLTPRKLPNQQPLTGVHVLRTLADATALREDLLARSAGDITTDGPRVVVVGDGVLGGEVAATARGLGCEVVLVGPQRGVLWGQLGEVVSGLLGEVHGAAGVELRLGTAVGGLTAVGGRVSGVELVGGEQLAAEVVVVALGAAPATEWLQGSGLKVADGVVCDEWCRAGEGIWAAGDVARWWHGGLNRLLRLENRTNASEQAAVVAANIAGQPTKYEPIPYFWTDQFTTKIQVHGIPAADAEVTVAEGSIDERRFVAHYRKDGRIVAVLGWNMPKQTRLHRKHLLPA
ncbi:FAD-dependent oxidoreductase [Kribbella sandramycini]|uniref:FAD-dependent oxidoreductase n=1 Tax=Kribbella sandramycini TaxID=60450 RepID=A0A7Y4P393_9ACTN|nr:FAD-dependent oxidoreductase [Kribbella sandramycini]MBB6567106.1 NADPH-dependent 2,4-dienoyl-CoA reductase/sulfur reductase-like enzyme [Kribbella sandramycini]NOL44823.1 FAD-dependent oxidoreductase [Kribbella sandramycini]